MRRTINISVFQEMFDYIKEGCAHGSASEYIRSLVRRDRERREDYRSRPVGSPARANDASTFAEALCLIDKLRAILEREDTYDRD